LNFSSLSLVSSISIIILTWIWFVVLSERRNHFTAAISWIFIETFLCLILVFIFMIVWYFFYISSRWWRDHFFLLCVRYWVDLFSMWRLIIRLLVKVGWNYVFFFSHWWWWGNFFFSSNPRFFRSRLIMGKCSLWCRILIIIWLFNFSILLRYIWLIS